MIKKGTSLPIKKIIGVLLALYVFNYFYQVDLITSILDIQYLHLIVMGIAAFYLVISGRQL